jgi:hypothetical protein
VIDNKEIKIPLNPDEIYFCDITLTSEYKRELFRIKIKWLEEEIKEAVEKLFNEPLF